MRITVDINSANLGLQLENAQAAAIAAVSEQALTDCNFYCKQDTETLIKSSLIHSDIDGGVLKWTEDYAEHQYTFPSARQDKNPNASPEWCERAYENHGDEWQRIFANTLRNGG